MSRGDKLYLEDIVESITAITDFTTALEIDSFRSDRKHTPPLYENFK